MKLNKISYIAILLIFSFTTSFANGNEDVRYKKWMKELMSYKQDFLTEELNLSSKQSQEFFPIYNEMEVELFRLNKGSRELLTETSNTDNLKESEYKDIVLDILSLKSQEARIEKSYYTKFARILSYKQLFLLQRAENRFSRNMLKHHKMSNSKQH